MDTGWRSILHADDLALHRVENDASCIHPVRFENACTELPCLGIESEDIATAFMFDRGHAHIKRLVVVVECHRIERLIAERQVTQHDPLVVVIATVGDQRVLATARRGDCDPYLTRMVGDKTPHISRRLKGQ
jgi:hypothetical protein